MSRSTPTKCVMRPARVPQRGNVHAAGNIVPSLRRRISVPRQIAAGRHLRWNVSAHESMPNGSISSAKPEPPARDACSPTRAGRPRSRARSLPSGRVIRIKSPVCSVAAASNCSRASARWSSCPARPAAASRAESATVVRLVRSSRKESIGVAHRLEVEHAVSNQWNQERGDRRDHHRTGHID